MQIALPQKTFYNTWQRGVLKVYRFIDWFNSDARHYQIIFLSLFLTYGLLVLQWDLNPVLIITNFFFCFITQAVCVFATTNDYRALKSACISALSLSLMLRTQNIFICMLAAVLSISGKYVFKVQVAGNAGEKKSTKHFFNPTNFGIIVTLLFTQQAWISPGQWGSSALLVFCIGILGFAVLIKVKRLDTALAFLITFLLLSFIRSVFVLGWPLDFFFHQLSSGTLLLFTFFMITDPVSTPSHPKARIVWSVAVALLAFYLGTYEFINGAPLWALFFLSPTTILLDKFFVHNKFSWQ